MVEGPQRCGCNFLLACDHLRTILSSEHGFDELVSRSCNDSPDCGHKSEYDQHLTQGREGVLGGLPIISGLGPTGSP